MCPQCGKRESVLESVTTSGYQCRAELGGCGALFDRPAVDEAPDTAVLKEAISTMVDAIGKFEAYDLAGSVRENPLGYRATAELIEVLRHEIGRLTGAME